MWLASQLVCRWGPVWHLHQQHRHRLHHPSSGVLITVHVTITCKLLGQCRWFSTKRVSNWLMNSWRILWDVLQLLGYGLQYNVILMYHTPAWTGNETFWLTGSSVRCYCCCYQLLLWVTARSSLGLFLHKSYSLMLVSLFSFTQSHVIAGNSACMWQNSVHFNNCHSWGIKDGAIRAEYIGSLTL